MDIFKAYIPISKVDDEQRMVFGYASTETVDSQGEVVERAAIEAALPDYMRFANIREMHTMSAVGVCKSADVDEKGLYIGAKVVDGSAWEKVKEGVYKGFSIGGRALEKADGIIKALRLTEISLVDRPANGECVIDCWKAETIAPEPEVAPAPATPKVADDPVANAAEIVLAKYAEGDEVWDASRALDALQAVIGLIYREGAEGEAAQVEMLRRAAAALKEFVAAEIVETAADHNGERVAMADSNVELLKAGAKYSRATKSMLAKVHGMIRDAEKAMAEMGYEDAEDDDAEKADDPVDLAKAEPGEALAKAEAELAKVSAERDDLAKRVAELEAEPEPAKAATTAVEKSEDVKDGLAAANSTPNPNDPLAMFKAALSRPIVVGGSPISPPSSAN